MGRRLHDEQGIALVMALGVLITITIATIAMLSYSSDNQRSAQYQKTRVTAYSLAEAGIAEAMAVLSKTSNNALSSTLLPSRTSTYDGGSVTWSGTLSQVTSTWTVTSTGTVANPSGGSAVTKTLTVHVPIQPTLGQTLNNQAWNYIYSFKPTDNNTSTCEMTVANSVNLATPLYVDGDLCINQTALISEGAHGTTLVVGGRLTLSSANQNFVGAHKSGSSTIVDITTGGTTRNGITAAYVAGGCKLASGTVHTTCSSADNVYAKTVGTAPPASVAAPTVQWDSWYNAASPGPKNACTTGSSGTTPTFDGNTTRDKSVTTAWNLTPSTSYDCIGASGGEIAWNATTKTLTVTGTVFIDGSAYVNNGSVNSYNGEGSLYLSGTFYMQSASLCAIVLSNGSGCDTANWNPNTETLVVVANGSGDNGVSCPSGYDRCDSVQLKSATFQGGVYATNNIELDTTATIDGPMVGYSVILGQSVNTSFPFITWVPVGTPGNPIVYAQPQAPTDYDG